MHTPRHDRKILIPTVAILIVFLISVVPTQEASAQTCIEKAGLALQGEYVLLNKKPEGVSDYIENTLFFPFGLLVSATVVAVAPLGAVLMPGDCFKDPALKEVDRTNFQTLQSIERNMSSPVNGVTSSGSSKQCQDEYFTLNGQSYVK